MRLANGVVRALIPVAARHDLTPQQAAVLFVLERADEPPTLAALGRALSVSKQNVTGMVARLVDAQLVRRDGDPDDQRASRLTLTKKGSAVTRALRPELEAWAAHWIGRWGEARADETLAKMIAALGDE
jgi:DNA-binding MarR family transcriptional regulator